jgi:phosphatidylinositol-3-phosphatase
LRRSTISALAACILSGAFVLGLQASGAGAAGGPPGQGVLPPGAIHNIMVIDVENEDYGATFATAGTYISQSLLPQGELLQHYYATGHVSLDNYISQVSGQAPNYVTNSDCLGSTGAGAYNDVSPGALDANQAEYPGQVDGQGCVFPSSVLTIGNQLDNAYPSAPGRDWRVYAQDMGNDPVRDGGTPDPLGGTDCAHPSQTNGVGVDSTETAESADQYADRHNPFIYFHSVTDDTTLCNSDVVPLGTVTPGTNGAPDTYAGHLVQDLATPATTPRFSFVVPNLCNDGHDASCAGTNTTGGKTGGLTAVNLWLEHWMPLILNSPAYQSGHMLVVITADEGSIGDVAAGDNEQAGPNNANPGYSPLLNVPIPAFGNLTYYQLLGFHLTPGVPPAPGTMPGGGQVGALLLNPCYVHVGTIDTTGSYNHYSALRTYEDLLGIDSGGSDGQGHLGFAATAHDFGSDVFVKSQCSG